MWAERHPTDAEKTNAAILESGPLEFVEIDIIGPLLSSTKGNQHVTDNQSV